MPYPLPGYLESTTPRKAYSQSTLGSPNMSNRVKQALDERRDKLSASRGGDGLMHSPGEEKSSSRGRNDTDRDSQRVSARCAILKSLLFSR